MFYMRKFYFFFISVFTIFILFTINAIAQSQLWSNCGQQNTNPTYANDIAVDSAGNTYTTGYFVANNKNNFFISKTNKNGVQQWTKYFPENIGDTASEGEVITVNKNGYITVAGIKTFGVPQFCSSTVKKCMRLFLFCDITAMGLFNGL